MGLNVLKWIYKLGVTHERRRIARYLQGEQDRLQLEFERYENNHRYKDKADKDYSDKLKKEVAATTHLRTMNIISNIFDQYPTYTTNKTTTSSIMFPEGEEKL